MAIGNCRRDSCHFLLFLFKGKTLVTVATQLYILSGFDTAVICVLLLLLYPASPPLYSAVEKSGENLYQTRLKGIYECLFLCS